MADAKAKFRIEGEDATAAAFRSALGNAQGTAKGIANAFKYAFAGVSVAALTGVAAQAIEVGDSLNKAAIKAGIGGKAMSELAHAAKMADVDLASLSTSIKKMQVNLSEAATGGKAQQQSLAALGLTFQQLQGMGADKQFERIADRIAALKDPTDRARAATEIFGKAGADLLPLFSEGAEGIRKARQEAEKLGVSFSDEQIKKLADADDAVKRLKASWEGFSVSLTSKVAPAITSILDLLSGNGPGRGGITGDMGKAGVLKDLQRQINSLVANANMDSPEMRKIKEGMVADLEERMRRIAAGGGGRGRRDVAVTPGFADADAQAKAKDAAEKQAKSIQDIQKESATWSFELSKQMEEMTSQGADAALKDDEERAAARLKYFDDTFNREVEVYKEAQDKMTVYAEEAARNMQDSLAEFLFDPFHDGLKGMLKGFVDTIRKMVAETAAANIFDSFGGSKGIASGIGGFAKKLLGFADGGSFSGREPFVVGERGPEIVVPGGSGSVIPNHKLGGGSPNISVNIDARGSTTDSVTQLRALMPSIIRQAVDMSRAAVRDDLSRRAYG